MLNSLETRKATDSLSLRVKEKDDVCVPAVLAEGKNKALVLDAGDAVGVFVSGSEDLVRNVLRAAALLRVLGPVVPQ